MSDLTTTTKYEVMKRLEGTLVKLNAMQTGADFSNPDLNPAAQDTCQTWLFKLNTF